jgi:hypothetical protein
LENNIGSHFLPPIFPPTTLATEVMMAEKWRAEK